MNKIKVTMYFPSNEITQPVTYHLIRDYDLKINILHADISLNKTGKLVADISGTDENLKKGLDFVSKQGVEYKIFNKAVIWNEDKCVHCGACTSVCPSGALTMDLGSWSLTFDREKCLVCQLCVKACPLKVISVTDNGREHS